MTLGNWNLEWLNHNGSRSYPLTDWATSRDVTQSITLPDDFIVALYFPVHAGNDVLPEKFFLRQLGIYPTGYNVAIAYDDGTENPPIVAAVNIAKSVHAENRTYALVGIDDFDDSVGRISIGTLDSIDQLPTGLYYFAYADGALETDCIWPSIRGVSSITVVNGLDRSPRLYGDVELVAGTNMRLTVVRAGDADPEVIFNAISGEGLNEECECDDDVEDSGGIKFINGIPPLPDGNFRMVGDACLDISPITNGLSLSDRCSQPCCGCDELQALTQQIDRFADGFATISSFATRIDSNVSQMQGVIYGSRLGGGGCLEC